ncbi:hypothetical protein IQ274_10385 [Nostoc sp. LEGE 12447]|uniref:Effector-associated domain-containing protein n=2 Tax=Nostoc TaxID=1177 RepID=A0ABR8IB39_9NOSO|nr:MULTISPECIES: hypothetical protein [Nostoc]MBD2562632.1 hypothetical protein [Nostoc linckia FACHB-391]MBD2647670.1 hypothetical protein [Nostoc foliaceum FACHB-393]MBE8998609.1 hypothetical protein [Nostoc sp. LEGE 12447]
MSSTRRLQVIYESKQQEWETVHERLNSLRQSRTIETDPENHFKLDRRVKAIEQELKVIQDELNQIEHQLDLLGSSKDESTPEKVTQTSFVQQQRRERSDIGAYQSSYASKPSTSSKRRILAGFLIMAGIGLIGSAIYLMVIAPYAIPVIALYGLLGLLIGGIGIYLW